MEPAEKSKSLIKERFGRFSEEYVASTTHARGAELDRIAEIADPRPEWLTLDIATGGGHTALRFAPHVRRAVATDLTWKMLESARRFISEKKVQNVAFTLSDAEAISFGAEIFDLVTCRIAPHHFSDCRRFVSESVRVLRPGGLLVIQDQLAPEDAEDARFVEMFERLRDPSHLRGFSRREWVDMLTEAGLEVTHAEELTKIHQFYQWTERQGCTPETTNRLTELLRNASPSIFAWLAPEDLETPEARFLNRQILLAGKKPS
jgi:ubiquinone/menaquinone biosynthesis C-methylase UbiE